MKRFLFCSAMLLWSLGLWGQKDSLDAASYVAKSVDLLAEGKKDSAALVHGQALSFFQRQGMLRAWLKAHVALAYVWAEDLQEPFVGINFIGQALQNMPQQPQTNTEWEQVALTHMAKGYIFEEVVKDRWSARGAYEQAYHLFTEKLQGVSDRIARYLLHHLGNIYTRYGDQPRAEALLRQGNAYGRAHPASGVSDHSDLSIIYIDNQQYTQALSLLQEGLATPNLSLSAKVSILQNKAIALQHLGRGKEALAVLNEARAVLPKMSPNDEPYYRFQTEGSAGEVYALQKNHSAAAHHYHLALDASKNAWRDTRRREVGKIHVALGELQLQQSRHAEALPHFHEALRCVLPEFSSADLEALPDTADFYSENTILEGLEGKARAFRALGKLELALACYERIPVVEAALVSTYAYESSSLRVQEEARDRFNAAVAIAWDLYERNGRQPAYADRAFLLTEQARAVLLLLSLAKAQADYQLPAALRDEENALNAKIAWYEQQIKTLEQANKPENAARLQELKQTHGQLVQARERFRDALRVQYPDYASLGDKIRFVQRGKVRSLLRNGQAMLNYYLDDTDLYVFYFGPNEALSWAKRPLPGMFRDNMLRFFKYLAEDLDNPGEAAWFRNYAALLHDLLLRPELEATGSSAPHSLLIVPDDALVFLPFEVLLRHSAAPDAQWRDLPYLLLDFNFSYAYSATLLDMQQRISAKHRAAKAPRHLFAGFAPSYGSSAPAGDTRAVDIPDSLIYDIKSTRTELEKVQALIGGAAFYDSTASEARFKAVAPDCRILLLAMHGLANDEFPELSCLLFGRPQGADMNNNVLFSNELQIMQLQADLAVLSACHTGFGKLHKGEGVYSLARAFAVAGVPSTVMSLWRLSELSAPPLVEAFFKYLKSGKTKDEALRLAKMDYLRNDAFFDRTKPFFWAGLSVSGDACALDFGGSRWWMWLALLVIPLLFLGRRFF
jgi:CHAT domain-containing protein